MHQCQWGAYSFLHHDHHNHRLHHYNRYNYHHCCLSHLHGRCRQKPDNKSDSKYDSWCTNSVPSLASIKHHLRRGSNSSHQQSASWSSNSRFNSCPCYKGSFWNDSRSSSGNCSHHSIVGRQQQSECIGLDGTHPGIPGPLQSHVEPSARGDGGSSFDVDDNSDSSTASSSQCGSARCGRSCGGSRRGWGRSRGSSFCYHSHNHNDQRNAMGLALVGVVPSMLRLADFVLAAVWRWWWWCCSDHRRVEHAKQEAGAHIHRR
mmetsp:Transcript_36645/g.85899  ORF Transcript_36645/g.85899 Transcript_36645/m.85899 type:complete len:261 (-) Transcript_36645:63-845(-)